VGRFSLKANYLATKAFDNAGATIGDWRVAGFGGEYRRSDHEVLTAAYYRGTNRAAAQDDDRAHSVVVSAEHRLSKRTFLYGQLAGIRAGRSAGQVVSLLGRQPVQDATTAVLNLGVCHRF
jgi:predicted porin